MPLRAPRRLPTLMPLQRRGVAMTQTGSDGRSRGGELDIPADRRRSHEETAARLAQAAAEVARDLPLSADVDDFRRVLMAQAPTRQRTGAVGAAPTDSVRGIAQALQRGETTSEALVIDTIERLRAAHAATHCLIAVDADASLRARAVDKARSAGTVAAPFAGVPLAHKDMFDRAGAIASWGAKIRAEQPAREDATVLARLAEAGTIQVAGLHLTEFAFGPTGHNYVLGHARNPWDGARVTGGSSSGTACAVALGAIAAGLGSDTGGSLRLPAAACGITSIKPTWGRVSRAGAMPLAASLDTIGVIARHVEDLATLLGVLAGADARDPAASALPVPDYLAQMGADVGGVRLGIDERLIGAAAPEVVRGVEAVIAVLADAGLTQHAVTWRDWDRLDQLVQLTQMPDASAAHAHTLRARPGDYGPQVRARLEVGHFIGAVDHMTALRARGRVLADVLATTFAGIDVAILPVFADPVPTIAETDVGGGPTVGQVMGRIVKFTRPINYLGLPTLTLPVPRSGAQRPNGIQLIARPYDEGLLFAIGRAYQQRIAPEIARVLA
jgi:aspartyl-tRNA(Asn)/glutamyl-tRNA(Gln) amidotransferase subunit A